MNKLVGYTVLVLGTLGLFLLIGLFNTGFKDIVYEMHGVQFENLEKNQAISPSNVQQFFVSKYSEELTFYRYPGHWNEEYKIDLSIYKTTDTTENLNSLSFKAVNNQIDYTEYMRDLDKMDLVDLVSNIKDFQGLKLSTYNYEDGFFGYIDDTPIIFIMIGFIFFLLCLVYNGLYRFIDRRFGAYSKWILPSLLLMALIYLIVITNLWIWFPYTQTLNTVRKIATILIPFLVFHFVIGKSQNLDFADKEVLKFFTIIIGTFGVGYLISQIGFAIDSGNCENIIMVENHGPHPLIIGISIALATGNLLANLVRRMVKIRGTEKILVQTQFDAKKSESQLNSLESSVNPHFLYNALNSIASTAKTDGEKTEKMALALSSFYKYVTNKNEESTNTIREELEMVDNYLEIEKIRFGDNLEVDIVSSQASQHCLLPRFILQPLIENAIKYGYGENGINIKITTQTENENLVIKVYDSGKSFNDIQMGFGLKSVMTKLDQLFPDQHTIQFVNEPKKHVAISIKQNNR